MPLVRSERLCVGKTHRWVLAWSFCAEAETAAVAQAASGQGPFYTEQPRPVFDKIALYLGEQLCLTMRKCDPRTLTLLCALPEVLELSVSFLLVQKPNKWMLQTKCVGGDAEMCQAKSLFVYLWRCVCVCMYVCMYDTYLCMYVCMSICCLML